MRVLVCISNYGDHQLEYLQQVVQEYSLMASSGFSIDLIVDSTVELDFSSVSDILNIVQHIYSPQTGKALVFAHRSHVIDQKDGYDLFIYTENDILITRKNITAYLSITKDIPENYITGFLRYERKKDDGQAYLIDAHPNWPIILENTITINGIDYIALVNAHHGGWILTKKQLRHVLNSGGFTTVPHKSKRITQAYDTLESGATDVYTQCGFVQKILPINKLQALMVHHLPDKYVNSGGIWDRPGPLTLDRLKAFANPRGKSIRINNINSEAIIRAAVKAIEDGRIFQAQRILRQGVRYCPQSQELSAAYNLLTKKLPIGKVSSTNKGSRGGDFLYLGLSPGENFGWGVCSNYLIKELAQKRSVRVLDEENSSSKNKNLPGKLFKTLLNINFVSLYESAWGQENFGYTFFENELSIHSIENARKYDKILAGSSWCRDRMLEKGINNCGLLIQGIDPEKFYPITEETSREHFVIFSGGKFELRKGQDLVLRAMKILQKKYSDIILVNSWQNIWPETMHSMGTSPYIKYEYKKGSWLEVMKHIYQINDLDPERIITLELVPSDELRQIYKQTDIGVFPNRCEGGTNLVLMEYMACAKPVIVSDTSGHRDIVSKNNALLLNDLNDIQIVDANKELTARWQDPSLDEIICTIEFAYHHREEIKKIGGRAGQDLKEFTWEKSALQLLSVLYE